jgi:hypothetical protein
VIPQDISESIIKLTDSAKTMGDLHQMLHAMAFTIGGMVLHFPKDERSQVIMELTESLGMGFMNTSKNLGETSSIEMVVGRKGK